MITNALLSGVLLMGLITLVVAIRTLRSSRRSENLGENRYELLRDQQERLHMMQEERRVLEGELKRESKERQQLMEILQGQGPQLVANLVTERKRHAEIAQRLEQQEQQRLRLTRELQGLREELERERREHQEVKRRAEGLELEHERQSQIEQEIMRLEQEHRRATEDLAKERETRFEMQRLAEQQDQERKRLEQELQRLQGDLDSQEPLPLPEQAKNREILSLWGRRPVLIVGLLFGVLLAWFVSLTVALSLLAS